MVFVAVGEDCAFDAIGIVDLDAGPRLMCRMIGEVGTQHLDQAVEMLVLDYEDGPLFGARLPAGA